MSSAAKALSVEATGLEGAAVQELVDLASSDPEARRALVARRAIFEVGRQVRAMREEAGLTQVGLAERAGLTQARVSIIESGESRHGPTVDVMARIYDACGRDFGAAA